MVCKTLCTLDLCTRSVPRCRLSESQVLIQELIANRLKLIYYASEQES